MNFDKFPTEVVEKLGYYVYRLIDPRNGNTFYVGKGKGNRIFQHLKNADKIGDEDKEDLKTSTINDIKVAGLEPIHIIHRHGITDESTAHLVEAALLDATPEAQNIQGGHGSDDFGPMHSSEILNKYMAETAVFEHKLLLITVNNSVSRRGLYEATRLAWKIKQEKAEQAELALAVVKGIIKAVYIPQIWKPATIENFPHRTE
ncbi:MAG: hypothetical protein RIA69_17760, partial [Cyclobacteriaceae bacterium]